MRAIVLCGFAAAGKTTVGTALSQRLGVPLIGGTDILREMAIKRGYKPTGLEWWDTPEGLRFHKEREQDQEFDKETDRIIAEKIANGNIIITSYTAPWLVKDGFKVWLDASRQARIERAARRDNTPESVSDKMTKARDKENQKLYKGLYDIDFGVDMAPFDLIIDTTDKTPEEIAEIILTRFNNHTNKDKE